MVPVPHLAFYIASYRYSYGYAMFVPAMPGTDGYVYIQYGFFSVPSVLFLHSDARNAGVCGT